MLNWKSTASQWGLLSIGLHWLTAASVFGLYALGWYMVDLDYYDEWYRSAPFWHKSVGLLLVAIVILRLNVRIFSCSPDPLPSHASWEIVGAKLAHACLYILLLVSFASGYLISTADGRGISFFDLFDVPALITDIDNLEDIAGEIHELATDALVVLALVHGIAALKHHYFDRDATLKRMLGINDINNEKSQKGEI